MEGVCAMQRWRSLKTFATSYTQRCEVLKLAKSLGVFLRRSWDQILQSVRDSGAPIMLCYMSDGWSAFSWKSVKYKLDGKAIADWQRERSEYLTERGILKCSESLGVTESAISIVAPRPLYHSKTAWNMFTCYLDFHPSLRAFSTGPIVTFGCFDGLHLSSMKRMMHGRRQLYYEYLESTATDADCLGITRSQKLIDFIFTIHCVAHAFSLAVKWA